MKTGTPVLVPLACTVIIFSLASCGTPTGTAPVVEPAATESAGVQETHPEAVEEAAPTEAAADEPAAVEKIVTQVKIDGSPEDWEKYEVLTTDPAGDNQGGGFDITAIRAFMNDKFLYLLVETARQPEDYVQIDLNFTTGEKTYVVTFDPRENTPGSMGDASGGEWKDIGELAGGQSAVGEVIEYKMPLTYFQDLPAISMAVYPMAGECCDYPAWYRIDEFHPVIVRGNGELEMADAPEEAGGAATITHIAIDGDPADWAERSQLKEDPVGDNTPGTLDLTGLYGFKNQDSFYLMMPVVDPAAEFAEVNFIFLVGEERINVSWKGQSKRAFMMKEGPEPIFLGDTGYSSFVLGSVLEARIDFRDLGRPEDVKLDWIDVMTGPPWAPADNFQHPLIISTVNESDPPEFAMRIPSYALADWMELPEGWQIENVFSPPLTDIFQLARSKNGTIFAEQHTFTSAISAIDPQTGDVKRVIDLPWEPGATVGIAGGPGDTVFRAVRNEIWQISPDGTHEVWGKVKYGEGTHPTFYTEDGRMIGFKHSNPTCVIEIFPNETTKDLACGFKELWDVIADKAGNLYVADWFTGRVTRVALDGSRQIMADKVTFRDPIDLAFNDAGELFMSTVGLSFQRWDPEAKKFVSLDEELTACAFHAADFEFAENSRVIFMDPTWGMATWADLDTGASGMLVGNEGANTQASAVGPDDYLYYATLGCRGDPPAEIMRVKSGYKPETVAGGLPDLVLDLAVTPGGELFAVANLSEMNPYPLYFAAAGSDHVQAVPGAEGLDIRDIAVMPDGNLIGWIHKTNRLVEFSAVGVIQELTFNPPELIESLSLDFGPDGYLYGFAELARNNRKGPMVYRQLLQIDPSTGQTKVIFQKDIDRAFAGGTMDAAPDGSFWIILFPDFEIYHVLQDGTAERLARELPVDSWRVNVDSGGGVYFNSPSGIYRIYQTTTQ